MLSDQVKTLVKTAGDPVFWALSRRELTDLFRKYPGGASNDILAITSLYRGFGWYKRLGAYQVPEEFRQLSEWALAQRPATVVEIGTASGATLLMWSRIASKRVLSIDLPGGIHGGGYPEQKARLFHEFVRDRPSVRVDLLRASSQDPATRDQALRVLGQDRADILFIDGDHRLEGVRRDFELWRDVVRPGGHVVFHDILPCPSVPSSQVDVLWDEIKAAYPGQTSEIVHSRDQGWAGIGLLRL